MKQNNNNLTLHESKRDPSSIPNTKIVEAYGLRKCPKLVEQVADDDLDVRQNALAVLCDEFRNPYVIQGCCDAGVIKVLASMITDPDYITRLRASKALSIVAEDACGLESILIDDTIPDILQGMNDGAIEVRRNVYDCLYNTTRTSAGVASCVRAGVTSEFVSAVDNEDDSLKPIILKTVHNACKVDSGLKDALNAGAVRVCINLLRRSSDDGVVLDAGRTLGFLCYSEEGKTCAIEEHGIEVLIEILRKKPSNEVGAAVTLALMSVSSTDEGKQQISECGGVITLVRTLELSTRIVKLNVLKIISNLAVYPAARNVLKRDDIMLMATEGQEAPTTSCVAMIQRLQLNAKEQNDTLMSKHAAIALSAVLWKP